MASANTTGLGGVVTGTLGSATTGLPFLAGPGRVNISARGTFVATVQIERSFDGGTNWFACSSDGAGATAAYTAPFSVEAEEGEINTLYRLNCTAWTSGTITYRISQ